MFKQPGCFLLWILVLFNQGVSFANQKDESSMPDYIPWMTNSRCLLSHIRVPKIKLCINGNGDHGRAQKISEETLQLWLEAVENFDDKVTREIEFSCENPHGTITVFAGSGRESASPGHINVFDGSYLGSYLHEFGHAFACLGDTYAGSSAGHCVAGQPHSIMCDGLLRKDLSQDDIDGLGHQFKQWQENGWL